jgi:hypothetical protein
MGRGQGGDQQVGPTEVVEGSPGGSPYLTQSSQSDAKGEKHRRSPELWPTGRETGRRGKDQGRGAARPYQGEGGDESARRSLAL